MTDLNQQRKEEIDKNTRPFQPENVKHPNEQLTKKQSKLDKHQERLAELDIDVEAQMKMKKKKMKKLNEYFKDLKESDAVSVDDLSKDYSILQLSKNREGFVMKDIVQNRQPNLTHIVCISLFSILNSDQYEVKLCRLANGKLAFYLKEK